MASMTLKTYRAHTMAQALAEVKKDLGADAVILHTRTYRTGGVMGFGGRSIVEITVSNDARVATRSPRSARSASAHEPKPAPASAPASAASARAAWTSPRQSAPSGGGDEDSRRSDGSGIADQATEASATGFRPLEYASFDLREPARANPAARVHRYPKVRLSDVVQEQPAPPAGQAQDADRADLGASPPSDPHDHLATPHDRRRTARLAVPATLDPVDQTARASLEDELASIKRLMGHVLQCSRRAAFSAEAAPGSTGATHVGDALADAYLRLTDQAVAPALAEELIGHVRDELTPAELADPGVVQQTLVRQIAARIPVAPGVQPSTQALGTIALLGPTGVGKTTTLAKLAAAYKLRHGRRVGLVTCDTYRIAAVEQLRTYANIIGLPVRVASTPQEMGGAIESLADYDVVLIDTPGRSQHDATRLEELRQFIDAADPDERHLVLSAAASEPVIERAAERFGQLGPDRLLITKLDEAVVYGPVVTAAARLSLPLGFVTTGQEVPDHIERANPDRLARLVLGISPHASHHAVAPAAPAHAEGAA